MSVCFSCTLLFMGKDTVNKRMRGFKVNNEAQLKKVEKEWRDNNGTEAIPYAKNTGFVEIATKIVPDKRGPWKSPLLMVVSRHNTNIGARQLCMFGYRYLCEEQLECEMDILSITAGMENDYLTLRTLIRYYDERPNMEGFFEYIGEDITQDAQKREFVSGELIIPDEIKNFSYTQEEIEAHKKDYNKQQTYYENCSEDKPFLNQLKKYTPKKMFNPMDDAELIYDLRTKDMMINTHSKYSEFINMFSNVMNYANGIEYNQYIQVILGNAKKEDFLDLLETYVRKEFVEKKKFPEEDVPILMKKLHRSLFELYIVQDLIDDPMITDIKITAPDCIRVRVKGKAYLSNVTFLNELDYLRFVNSVIIKNQIHPNVPSQTFTDDSDENYALRFTLSSEYVNSVSYPYLHIRKISKKKLMDKELMEAGMFDEVLRDYLIDCGKNSRGVVFAGPPGSGKTVILNWFLEAAYEQSAEILIIQENNELFAYRKGVMIQQVVNYPKNGEMPCDLEDLGKLALVAGANVFIIGEAKGAEICSAITLGNSGCRTAITLHSNSSTETLDKMADLAMRGHASSIQEAMRSLKSFQTIVYMEDFSIKEISEIIRYDEEKEKMEYRCIYRKPKE